MQTSSTSQAMRTSKNSPTTRFPKPGPWISVPPHVELMRRLELVDYEPGSDPGNMRFYPKGRLIKSLLENYVLDKASDMGAMEVETPIMYDMDHPTSQEVPGQIPGQAVSDRFR